MRARSSHQHWEPIVNRDHDWLAAIDPGLDLLAADDDQWRQADGAKLSQAALQAAIGPYRGASWRPRSCTSSGRGCFRCWTTSSP